MFRFSNIDSDDTTVVVKKKKKIVVLLFTHQRQQGGWVRDVGGSRAHSLGGTFEIKFLLNFCQYSLSFFSFLFFISTHHHLCVQYNKRIESLGKRKYSGVDLKASAKYGRKRSARKFVFPPPQKKNGHSFIFFCLLCSHCRHSVKSKVVILIFFLFSCFCGKS